METTNKESPPVHPVTGQSPDVLRTDSHAPWGPEIRKQKLIQKINATPEGRGIYIMKIKNYFLKKYFLIFLLLITSITNASENIISLENEKELGYFIAGKNTIKEISAENPANGKYSLKVSYGKFVEGKTTPYPGITLYILKAGLSNDWSQYNGFSFSVYNPMDFDVTLGLNVWDENSKGTCPTVYQKNGCILKAKKMNRLTIKLNGLEERICRDRVRSIDFMLVKPAEETILYFDEFTLEKSLNAEISNDIKSVPEIIRNYRLVNGKLYYPESPQPFPFIVRYLPSYNTVWISEADISKHPQREFIKYLNVQLKNKADGKIILQQKIPFTMGKINDFAIRDADLSGGVFQVIGQLLDSEKKIIDSTIGVTQLQIDDLTTGRYASPHSGKVMNEHLSNWVAPFDLVISEFTKIKYPFLNTSLGKKRFVLPPFEPVRLENKIVYVWGREYQLNDLGLPEQVIARQVEPTVGNEYEPLLSSGSNLLLQFNNLEEQFKATAPLKVIETADDQVTVAGEGRAGDVKIFITNTIQADGLMKFDMTIVPEKKTTVKTICLDIFLKADQSTLMHYLSDNVYPKIYDGKEKKMGGHAGFTPRRKSDSGVVWNSSEVDRIGKVKGSFIPMIWLGNEDRGFCWFADSDRGWILDDRKAALELIRNNDTVVLKVKFVNKDTVLEQPAKIVFGLLATPVKPLPLHWRGWIFPRWSFMDWDLYKSLGSLRKIVEIGAGDPKFHSGMMSPLAGNWQKTKEQYKDIRHKLGTQNTFMEYWCSDIQTLDAGELMDYFGEWIRKKPRAIVYSNYPGQSRDGCTAVLVERSSPSFQDYKIWCLNKKLKEVGLFAYYEDNSQQYLSDNKALGMGYVRNDGSCQPEFDIFAYHDYIKRVAMVYHENGFENLGSVHKSVSMMIPAYTYAAVAIDGEQPSRNVLTPDKDYIDLWPDLEYIRAHIMGRQYGIVSLFMSHILIKEDPDGKQTRALMALMLPHDVSIWDGSMPNRSPLRKWHEIQNKFGFGNENTRIYPYWSNSKYQPIKTDSQDILTTVWQTNKKLLIVLSNLKNEASVNATVDFEKLGYDPDTLIIKDVKDAETDEKIDYNKSLNIKIRRHDYKIIWMEMQ